jgi:predicted transcriptional regulator
MKKLTSKEEQVMEILWQHKKGFVKDLLTYLPPPKPHYNTLSTIIRNLEQKGYIGHTQYGNTYEYYPLLTKLEYKETFINNVLSSFFDNSYKKLVSFFAQEEKISAQDLEEIIEMINQKNLKK